MPRVHLAAAPLTADSMAEMILHRISELDRAIASATDPADLRRLMSERLDGYDILTTLARR